jgi:hypothetical protein
MLTHAYSITVADTKALVEDPLAQDKVEGTVALKYNLRVITLR